MFDHCLYFNTTALARRLEALWAEAYMPFGLTPPQGFLLRAVLRRPGLAQGELAQALAIARPTATRALDGLVAKRLLVRKASEVDGRGVHVHPTAKAVALRSALDAASATVTARIKTVIGEAPFTETVTRIKGVRSALQ